MNATLSIKKPKIQEIDDKKCLYLRMQGAYQTLDFASAWKKIWEQVKTQKLFTKGIQHFGLPYDDPKVTHENKIRYDACLIIHKTAKPVGGIGLKP